VGAGKAITYYHVLGSACLLLTSFPPSFRSDGVALYTGVTFDEFSALFFQSGTGCFTVIGGKVVYNGYHHVYAWWQSVWLSNPGGIREQTVADGIYSYNIRQFLSGGFVTTNLSIHQLPICLSIPQ